MTQLFMFCTDDSVTNESFVTIKMYKCVTCESCNSVFGGQLTGLLHTGNRVDYCALQLYKSWVLPSVEVNKGPVLRIHITLHTLHTCTVALKIYTQTHT